jgi:hypothetical protein
MNTEAIVQQPSLARSPRTAISIVLALVVGALVGAGAVALVSSDTSESRHAIERPAAVAAAPSVETCPGDGGVLLSAVMSMPIEVSNQLARELSAPTRALLASASELSALTATSPSPADPTTLAGVLTRIGSPDADAVTSGLPPLTRAAIEGVVAESACP